MEKKGFTDRSELGSAFEIYEHKKSKNILITLRWHLIENVITMKLKKEIHLKIIDKIIEEIEEA